MPDSAIDAQHSQAKRVFSFYIHTRQQNVIN